MSPSQIQRRDFIGSCCGRSTQREWRGLGCRIDKPEKEEVKIGFIPLTDCASVVMASCIGPGQEVQVLQWC